MTVADTSRKIRVGIVGGAGVLGEETLRVLALREIPVSSLKLFESDDRIGSEIEFGNSSLPVDTLSDGAMDELDVVIFAGPPEVSAQWLPVANELGLKTLDYSEPPRAGAAQVPAIGVVRETEGTIRVPSSSATILSVVIAPLQKHGYKIERLRVTGMLSVSEAGRTGIKVLSDETRQLLTMQAVDEIAYGGRLAFNVVAGAFTQAVIDPEQRAVSELSELLRLDKVRIAVMFSFVPVFFGHTYAVEIETTPRLTPEKAAAIFEEEDLLEVSGTGPEAGRAPMASQFAGNDEIGVGRFKASPTGLQFWVAADNIRTVARNAVQLLERALGLETSVN